jgi:putative SOS response-associated peptidase YedK
MSAFHYGFSTAGPSIALDLACDYHKSTMCGRYTLTADLKKVADRFGAPMPVDEWATCALPRYNIAPTQAVIVVGDDGNRCLKPMRWGLIPSWATDHVSTQPGPKPK